LFSLFELLTMKVLFTYLDAFSIIVGIETFNRAF
jgi:hypothetical protein